MKAVISILNWNAPEVSVECINSVIEHTKFESIELWLTDNGSFDNKTADVIREYERYPFVKTVYHQYNMGFIGGQNYVFNMTDSEYFLTLSNDTLVCPDWFDILLSEMKYKHLAQVGVWISGVTYSKLNTEGGGYRSDSKEDADYVDGFCMMVRRKAVLSVGRTLFSEYLKVAYYEDSDLSLRLRAAKYKVGLVELPIKHYIGYTTKRPDLLKKVDMHGASIRNRETFIKKWSGFLTSCNVGNKMLVKRYGGIGDVLWTTPVIRALKQANPDMDIDFLTSGASSPLLQRNPIISNTITNSSSVREIEYRKVVDLNMAYENNPMTLLVEAYANAAGVPVATYRPEFMPDVHEAQAAVQKLGSLAHNPYMVLHVEPAFLWAGRTLPTSKAQEIVEYMKQLEISVVEIGSAPAETLTGVSLDLKGKLSISETSEIIRKSLFFIGVYSGPAVIAMAMDVPSIVLFGSISPEYRIPHQLDNVISINNTETLCIGCHHYKATAEGSMGTLYCMRHDVGDKCMVEFPMARVFSAIDVLVKKRLGG